MRCLILLCASLGALGCPAVPELLRPELVDPPHVYSLRAGGMYHFSFGSPIDDFQTGTRWSSTDLSESPLAFMERTPVILKADDYGDYLSPASVRFLEMVNRAGGVAALGVVTSSLTDDDQLNSMYRDLHRRGFELWFHGHIHDWSLPVAEFSGSGPQFQRDSFERGIALGRSVLGVDFHAFGAPGNAIDDDTAVVLEEFPQLVVWFFGGEGSPALVLPRVLEAEARVGTLREPGAFKESLEAVMRHAPEVLTLQVHPGPFGPSDIVRLEGMLNAIEARGDLRYTGPFDFWKWQQDLGRILVIKVGVASYILDLGAAEFDHRISFDPRGAPATMEGWLGGARVSTRHLSRADETKQ